MSEATVTDTAPSNPWIADEAGTFADGYLDRLPAELADAKPTLSKYKSFPELAKGMHHLQTLLGKRANAVYVPDEGATPEEKAAYLKRIGVPEKPDDYKFTGVEGLPPDRAAAYAKLAHEMGVPPAVAEKFVGQFLAEEAASTAAAKEAEEAAEREARGKLIQAFGPQYERKVELAIRAARTVGWNVEKSSLMADPEGVIALTKFADMISEDKRVDSDIHTDMHPGKTEAHRIMTDPTHPKHQRYLEGDTEVAAEVRRLIENG